MERAEIITQLESLARQSDDAALAEEAVVERFAPMFDAAFNAEPRTEANFKRATELRYNALERRHHVKRSREEAALFRAAIVLLKGEPA